MRNFGPQSRPLQAAFVAACAILGSVAVLIAVPAASSVNSPDIGEARVSFGGHSARIVEQVSYRDGIERIADLALVDGHPIGAIDNPDVEAAWAIVDSVWPNSIRPNLVQLSIVSERPRGLVGVVHLGVNGGWILSLDRADLGDEVLVKETIVHEIAHVATLGPDSFAFGNDVPCGGVSIEIGCAAADSVMARFAERFWPDAVATGLSSDYVDEYAASGPHEDLAETFVAWVSGWPIGSSEVEAKFELLSTDPLLASLAATLELQLG